MDIKSYLSTNLHSARIAEISEFLCKYYKVENVAGIRTEDKLDALCIAAGVSRQEIDEMIAYNSQAIRTIKGHVFEIVFSKILQINDIPHKDIGGDTDIDFEILGHTLQLKTPFVQGCTDDAISYKTHKTHGAKSPNESIDYYHTAADFADYLVGLISYDPFSIFIIPNEAIPRLAESESYLESPFLFDLSRKEYINNFHQLGINDDIQFPSIVNLGKRELLPLTADALGVRSNYIIDAIFIPSNFRIWDMNLRGFLRERHIKKIIHDYNLRTFDPKDITTRPNKVDLVLRDSNANYVRFQIKGLTLNKSRFEGQKSVLCCETQLSRGRANDHPTQSRLYYRTDFDELLIAMDPAYTNMFSEECFGKRDYQWSFYSVPMSQLRIHSKFPSRIASNQLFNFIDLQQYKIDDDWFYRWS